MTESNQPKVEVAESTTLKACARSVLDIGTFTAISAGDAMGEASSRDWAADKEGGDGKSAESSIGLFTIHRFTFIGDTVVAGQVQEVIGIAPRETVEVVTETTRRSSREDEYESTSEQEIARSTESKDMTEVADVVATSLTSTSRASTSAKVSATCGYASGEASEQSENSSIQSKSSQHTSKTVKEVAVKASDRMKRSIRLKVRNVQELTEVNSSRRLITNNTDHVMNIAVRSALRMETVVAQRIDTQLCMMLKIQSPGTLLAQGQVVGALPGTVPLSMPDLITTKSVEIPDPYSWKTNTGFNSAVVSVLLPANAQYAGPAFPLRITNFYAKSMGPIETQVVANEKTWGVDPFTIFVSTTEGRELKVAISMDVGRDGLAPSSFERGISFDFTFAIPLVPSDETVSQVLAAQRLAIDTRLLLKVRSQKDLRDEERTAVLGAVSARGGIERGWLDFEGAWYELPPPEGDNSKKENYLIGGTDSPPRPFGAGLGWDGQYAWDTDVQRFLFLKATSLTAFVPIVAGRELTVAPAEHPAHAMATYITNRRKRLQLARDSSGDMLDPGDVLRHEKTWDEQRWTTHDNAFQQDKSDDDDSKAVNYFPIVDRFKISTPVGGFMYELMNSNVIKGLV